MRAKAHVWLLFLIAVIPADPVRAQRLCDAKRHPILSLWMVAREDRAYFYAPPADGPAPPTRLKSFLVRGDVIRIARAQDDPANAEYPFTCAIYYGAQGGSKYGWLRKTDLVDLEDDDGDKPGPSPELRDVLSRLPAVTSWPSSGVSAEPCYHEEDSIGDFVCVRRSDPVKKELCVQTTHRPDDPPECGELDPGNRFATFEEEGWYVAYLLNNAIAIVSQRGMWGNHGQSDPEGVYLIRASASRTCGAGAGLLIPDPRRGASAR